MFVYLVVYGNTNTGDLIDVTAIFADKTKADEFTARLTAQAPGNGFWVEEKEVYTNGATV